MEKKHILVIEDEEDISYIIKFSLTKAGYNVTEANSGYEGISRAKKLKPDVITLDINMPGIDRVEMVKMLKNDEMTQDIPIFIVSGAEYKYRNECFELGNN